MEESRDIADGMITDCETLAGIVKEIIIGCLQKRKAAEFKSYTQLDTKIVKDRQFCSAQVMSTGRNWIDITFLLNKAFKSVIKELEFPINKALVAKVFTKSSADVRRVEVRDVVFIRNNSFSLESQSKIKEFSDYCHLKEYIAVKLEFKCPSDHYKEFANLITSNIMMLESSHPNVKFSVRVNKHYIYKNRVDLDEGSRCCKILASAMNSVIRQSLNEEFRKDCLQGLRVKRSGEINIFCHLMSMLNKNYVNPFESKWSYDDTARPSEDSQIASEHSKMVHSDSELRSEDFEMKDEDSEEDIFYRL